MSESVTRVNDAIREFVNGGEFMTLWREVMDFNMALDPDRDLAPTSRDVFEELYDLVYMGQAGEPPPEDRKVGLIGESELRLRLSNVQLVPRERPA
jgi:hypothetical protein